MPEIRRKNNQNMRKTDLFILAVKHLYSGKLRTFLTVLGMAVGTGALISVIALGSGGRTLLNYEMGRLGVNRIWVAPAASSTGKLELADAARIAQLQKDSLVSAVKTTYCIVSSAKESLTVQTLGCQENYFAISNMEIKDGRFFGGRDCERSMRIAVIDSVLAKSLFGEKNAVGSEIKVNGKSFSVIGVISSPDSSFAKESKEGKLYLPITSFLKDIDGNPNDQSADEITLSVKSEDVMAEAQKIVDFLGRTGEGGIYKAYTLASEIDVSNRVMDIFLTIVGSIAVVCMIVGGIGIMNMMVSSVRERKREIGVMLAVGATPAAVFYQVLTESTIMSMLGALFGIVMGALFTLLGCSYVGMGFMMPVWAIGVSIVFSVAIGVFFGAYPAYKAAKISPVEAMRA